MSVSSGNCEFQGDGHVSLSLSVILENISKRWIDVKDINGRLKVFRAGFIVLDTALTGCTILLFDAADAYHLEVIFMLSTAIEFLPDCRQKLMRAPQSRWFPQRGHWLGLSAPASKIDAVMMAVGKAKMPIPTRTIPLAKAFPSGVIGVISP